MNQYLKRAFLFFAIVSSVSIFAQDQLFSPKFTLGSGYYTLNGDIQNENTGFLKGIAGFNAGMKFELASNVDLSFLFIKTNFAASNEFEDFSSDVDGFGLHLGYSIENVFKQSKFTPILSLGIQNLSVSTINNTKKFDRESVLAIPFGFGLRMDITERLQLDVTINLAMGLSDIDMSKLKEDNADGFKSLNFTIHYDLFTPGKKVESIYFDDSYYDDVDFAKLESEDEDGDLVADIDDFCPKTPVGVKVDDNGCPLDDDKDGIANYLDQQKNTTEGSIVDEKGVELTDEKFRSIYSDYEAASREYAKFYNENEIKRENYKTTDEYLIAKANAFNTAYNQGEDFDNTKIKLKYKVHIGSFRDAIPPNIINKYLSLNDLESIPQDDGLVIYAVGNYNSWNDAVARKDLYLDGFDDTYILVDDNGDLSRYVAVVPKPEININQIVLDPNLDSLEKYKEVNDIVVPKTNGITYRIQIGAFPNEKSDKVFKGVDNLVFFKGNDGWFRYMTGSFSNYLDAIKYQVQMKARGPELFKDAFIVTFKDGVRISLNVAIKKEKNTLLAPELVVDEKDLNPVVEFFVQILVSKDLLSSDNLIKLQRLGDISKDKKGEELYIYYTGNYITLQEANISLEEAKLAGYSDSFVFAKSLGERITIQEAEGLLK